MKRLIMRGVPNHWAASGQWRNLGKSSAQNIGTFSATAAVISQFQTTGIVIPLKGRQAIHILQYWFDVGDNTNNGELFLAGQLAIDLVAGSIFLKEFCEGSLMVVQTVEAPPAARGMILSPTKTGITLIDDWTNWDDYVAVAGGSTGLGNLKIYGAAAVFNNTVGAHNINFLETCVYETWEGTERS